MTLLTVNQGYVSECEREIDSVLLGYCSSNGNELHHCHF